MITVSNKAVEIMHRDALDAFPDECCGFMFGQEKGEGNRQVTVAYPIHNSAVENRKRRFEIAPKDYLRGEQYALENDVQFLGIYHSHPNHPAIPSEHDRVAAQPWFSYVIISVSENEVKHARSWVLNDEFQFEEEVYNNQLTQSTK
jgi:proteasome lid subunit RPN8/RPN11